MAVHMGTSLQQAQGACRCEIEEWLLVQLATDWAAHTCTFAGIRENQLNFLFIYKNKEDCMWFLTLYQIQLQAAFLRELLDPLYARRAGDTHLITSLQSENNPIWALKAVTEEINGPRSASKYDVNGTTMANLEQGTEKYEECNVESHFGHVPQTEGPSPSHG